MIRILVCTTIACLTALIATFLATRPSPKPPTKPEAPAKAVESNPESLSPELQAWSDRLRHRRLVQLQNLNDYALTGRFPRNIEDPGSLIPVFVDDRNCACAVGQLMRASDREDIVSTVRASDNHLKIADIVDGPAMDWILTSGLTKEECALIQPSYEFQRKQRPQPEVDAERARIRTHLLAVHQQLVKDTEPSLALALSRLQRRLNDGPMPEACLREVQLVSLAPGTPLEEQEMK